MLMRMRALLCAANSRICYCCSVTLETYAMICFSGEKFGTKTNFCPSSNLKSKNLSTSVNCKQNCCEKGGALASHRRFFANISMMDAVPAHCSVHKQTALRIVLLVAAARGGWGCTAEPCGGNRRCNTSCRMRCAHVCLWSNAIRVLRVGVNFGIFADAIGIRWLKMMRQECGKG